MEFEALSPFFGVLLECHMSDAASVSIKKDLEIVFSSMTYIWFIFGEIQFRLH